MGRALLLMAGLLLALLGRGGARLATAAPDGDEETAVETLLLSPLGPDREEGVRLLTAAGSAGRDAARALCEAALLPLRLGGWRALAELGESEDLEAALVALEATDAQEAHAAGETLLRLAERLPVPRDAPVPEGRLSERATTALLGPLEDLLWRSSPEEVPRALLRLGVGLARPLAILAGRAEADRGLRAEAIDALGALGGPTARTALVRLVSADTPPEPQALFRALRQLGRGPGLEPVERAALACLVTITGPWRRALAKQEAALFLQACPPAKPDPDLRTKVWQSLNRPNLGPRGGMTVEMVRTCLALGPPSDEELGRAAGLLESTTPERGWMLLALEPWKDRPPVHKALERVVGRAGVPPAVAGWATLLLAGPAEPPIPALARAAIEEAVGGDGPDSRRLGLLLLGRLEGVPPADLVGVGLEETDSWCRVFALNLLARVPPSDPQHAVARRLAQDRDPWVVEAAASVPTVPWDLTLRRRLGEILLGGPRDLRTRVVNLLQRRGEAAGEEAPAEELAAGPIDVRLRLAALLEARATPPR